MPHDPPRYGLSARCSPVQSGGTERLGLAIRPAPLVQPLREFELTKFLLPLTVVSLLIINAIAGLASASENEKPEFRASVLGGVAFSQDYSEHGVTLDFDTGYAVSGIVDYEVLPNLFAQLEGTYTSQNLGTISFRGHEFDPSKIGLDKDLTTAGGFVNAIYRPKISDDFAIFAGGGVGGLDVCANVSFRSFSESYCDAGFAYQLIGGAEYQATDNSAFFLRYAYRRADGVRIADFGGYQGNIVQAGYAYRF